MTESKTALLLGATGLVGSEVLHLLLQRGEYTKTRVLVRRSTGISDLKLEEVVLDLNNLPGGDTYFDADVLFIAFGTTIRKAGSKRSFEKVDLEIPLAIAKRAVDSGTRTCILVSSVGADPASSVFYNRVKGKLEQALILAGFESVLIFRPSLLLGKRSEFRFGEWLVSGTFRFLRWIKDDLLGSYSPMPVSMLAAAMVNASREKIQGYKIYHYREIRDLSQ